ncbi:MAG: DUF1622 domain-containing protein [Chloroflexota bacterium]|nr:DUF1622 domain-containing protein [Chloroflexota bacterium]
MEFNETVERVGRVMEGAGIAIIVIGAAVATVLFLYQMRHGGPVDAAFRLYRRSLGRAILLGLEFLVAGDIISTVAIEPTFRSLGILAIIVAIRTFLSTELELEIERRWPWQQRRESAAGDSGDAPRVPRAGARGPS